jgi:hypothetical protein
MLELLAQQGQLVLEQAERLDCKEQLELVSVVLLVLQGKWELLELEFKEIMAQLAQQVLELLEQAEFKVQLAVMAQLDQRD